MTKILFTLLAGSIVAGCERQSLTPTTPEGTSVSKVHVIDAVTGACIRIEQGGFERNEYTRFIVASDKECQK